MGKAQHTDKPFKPSTKASNKKKKEKKPKPHS
jgi:hypothetical protein